MKKIFIYVLAFFPLLFSCKKDNNNDKELQQKEQTLLTNYLTANNITTPPKASGLYVIDQIQGTGDTIKSGDYIMVNYTGYLLSNNAVIETTDSVKANSLQIPSVSVFNQPILIKTNDSSILIMRGLREGLTYMNEGGSARFIIPSKLAFGGYVYSSLIPAYSTFIYDVQVVKKVDPIALDSARRVAWLRDSLQQTLADSTDGIYIKYLNQGVGDLATDGNTLTFKFTLRLMNGYYISGSKTTTATGMNTVGGTSFDPNDKGGWEKLLRKLRKYSKAKAIIPYYYAHGSNYYIPSGQFQILFPYYSSLVIDIEVTNLN